MSGITDLMQGLVVSQNTVHSLICNGNLAMMVEEEELLYTYLPFSQHVHCSANDQ